MEICVKKETVPVYPKDFYSPNDSCVVNISDEEINKWIEEGVKALRPSEEIEECYYKSCGNSLVVVIKSEIGYKFIVTKNYSDVDIIFED